MARNTPPRDIAAELRAEIARLEERARSVSTRSVDDWIRKQARDSDYATSRLERSAAKRHRLATLYAINLAAEMEKRLPQITRLKRKLQRLETKPCLRPPSCGSARSASTAVS